MSKKLKHYYLNRSFGSEGFLILSVKERFKKKIGGISNTLLGILIPLYQFVPTAKLYFGIMSLPLIVYLFKVFQYGNPLVITDDFWYFFPGYTPVIIGFILFLYSLIYLWRNKGDLVKTGPYKYLRHPQYLGIIIMTFGLTSLSIQTSPIFPSVHLNSPLFYVMLIWIAEVTAYVILAKLEESYLKSKLGQKYSEYISSTPFIIPDTDFIWYFLWFNIFNTVFYRIVTLNFGYNTGNIFISVFFYIFIGFYILYKKGNERIKDFFNGIAGKIRSLLSKMNNYVNRLILVVLSSYSYLPVIVGILAPMFALGLSFWYLSWNLFGFSSLMDWVLYYYLIPEGEILVWITVEALIFYIGLGIFLTGLITMIIGKIKAETIIQSGIYKFIRHPQTLGIIIMMLPFAFFTPGFEDPGIRMGDIFSWGLFSVLMCFLSYFEEWKLMNKYNTDFFNYYIRTGFFLPKFRCKYGKIPFIINYRRKTMNLFAISAFFMSIFYFTVLSFSVNLMLFK
ncbi:MAG: isoprenylcysteine carboxylmethyltransferase family protein [Promethearchaeota archaeon]